MQIRAVAADLSTLATPLLAVPVYRDGDDLVGTSLVAVDAATSGRLMRLAAEEGFDGKAGAKLLVHTESDAGLAAARVLLVGLGDQADVDGPKARQLSALAVREANARRVAGAAVAALDGLSAADAVRWLAEGADLGAYRFVTYKTKDDKPPTCEGLDLAVGDVDGADDLIAKVRARAAGICLARDLVNGPPKDVNPLFLAETAEGLARDFGLECTIFDKAEITARGMNLLLAVSAGSDIEPRFIHLTYRPEGATDETESFAFVGKGITFDAGGYNLKPTGAIEDMKMDMGGAAAVLGAMRAVAEIKPDVVVHGIVPTCENLISGSATKVSDIIKGLAGKTVEIMNTDAEGRLILADALAYAVKLEPTHMVDLATLTGACLVALGPYTAGLWSNDDAWGKTVSDAAEAAGESVWTMPLAKRLRSMLDSPNADIKNIGKRWGGAITAALFLETFVDQRSWTHLDIAGPAFTEKADALTRLGGTGFGVATLTELCERGA